MKYEQKIISVIGLGYIGLPTAALLASRGFKVAGVDINPHVVQRVNNGEIHIVEPGLEAFVSEAVANGHLQAYSEVQPADVYIICVPTPLSGGEDGLQPNLEFVNQAVNSISKHVKAGDMVVLESTSPVGTTDMIAGVLERNGIDLSTVSVAYCPERVLPGNVMSELVENARVIGGINSRSTKNVSAFYRAFVNGEILVTEAKTAEMCKLAENSYRDVNIAFANELSVLCSANGVNIWDLIKLANYHPRVNILQPGTGVGGHCIAVDPWFIVAGDPSNARIIKTAREVNDSKPDWVVEKIKSKARSLNVRKVACLGLAFKPNIDDLRGSPSLRVVESLAAQGFDVACVEPNIAQHPDYKLIDIGTALSEFEVIALLVKHQEFVVGGMLMELDRKGALDFCGAFGRD